MERVHAWQRPDCLPKTSTFRQVPARVSAYFTTEISSSLSPACLSLSCTVIFLYTALRLSQYNHRLSLSRTVIPSIQHCGFHSTTTKCIDLCLAWCTFFAVVIQTNHTAPAILGQQGSLSSTPTLRAIQTSDGDQPTLPQRCRLYTPSKMTYPLPTAMFPSGLDLERTKQLDGAYAQCHICSAIYVQ